MAEKHTKSLVSNLSGKYWEELCMTGNEMATSDCLGGGFQILQALLACAYQARQRNIGIAKKSCEGF